MNSAIFSAVSKDLVAAEDVKEEDSEDEEEGKLRSRRSNKLMEEANKWCSHSKKMRGWPEIRTKTFLLFFIILLLTLFSSIDACSCIYSHPQEHYCSADFVALVNVRRPGKGDHRVISYRVKVKREFKMTVKARHALSQGLIWTSGDESTCGRTFDSNTRYLITGRIVGEKPWVSVCNYVEKWSTLTYKQRKGFRRLYAFGCRCKVREPPSNAYYSYKHAQYKSQSPHRLAARPGYCHWETKWENQFDCQGLHSICTPVMSSLKRKNKQAKAENQLKKIKDVGHKSKHYRDLKERKKSALSLHECQWVHSEAYNQCMKTRKEKEESKWEEP